MAVVMEQFIGQANMAFVLPDKIPIPKSARLRRSMKHLNHVVYELIRARRAAPKHTGDLLGVLLEAQDEGGDRMADEQLRDEIMTLFSAGRDPTANALSWTWHLLAQNPEKEQTLYAELRAALGSRAPTAADLPQLRYTEMVIKESMRLYPPAWGVGRRAIRDFEWTGPHLPPEPIFSCCHGSPARRTIFHRTGTVRAGALARRPNSQWQTAEILLLSVWRWAQGLCRSGVRDDGSDAAAGDDCATLPAHAQSGADS